MVVSVMPQRAISGSVDFLYQGSVPMFMVMWASFVWLPFEARLMSEYCAELVQPLTSHHTVAPLVT